MSFLRNTLATVALIATISSAQAVTVSFSTGSNFTLFQSSDGSSLDGGYLHVGYYASDPGGLSVQDLRNFFQPLATHGNTSGNGTGYFGNGDFPSTPVGSAANKSLYLMITNTANTAVATEFAVLTNTVDPDWNFPSNDLGFNPSVSLNDIVLGANGSSILAGFETTSTITTGGPAIRLEMIPEPSTLLLLILGSVGILRRRR